MKKTIIALVVGIVIIIIIVLAIVFKNPKQETDLGNTDNTVTKELCYYKETKTSETFSDIAWIDMKITGDVVTGEFRNLPAEKDSKVGTFEGEVVSESQNGEKTADVWWEAHAEGTVVTEELRIIFTSAIAKAGFAEMVDRGDGVYVYKDKSAIGYFQEMPIIPCSTLHEKVAVPTYIRANIGSIVSDTPTLGGAWYVDSLKINSDSNSGTVVYSDGHVQHTADFSYLYDEKTGKVIISIINK